MARLLAVLLVPVLILSAAKKTVGTAKGENQDFILTATLHIDPEEIKEMIGSDLEGHFIVAEIKIDPKYGKDISVDRDDFVLRTDKDGERTKSFVGSQIAGRGVLVVGEGEVKEKRSGWGLGGPVMIGSGRTPTDDKDKPKPTMKNSDTENPLKKALDDRILPQKKTDQPVSGLLYFPMEKQKLKDLELLFGGKENRISLRFKPL